MKKVLTIVCVLVVVLVAVFMLKGKNIPEEVTGKVFLEGQGKVASVTGPVTLTKDDGSTSAAAADAVVREGDRLSAGKGACCAIEFEDGSSASLSPSTQVTVTKLDKKITAKMLDIELKLDLGKILLDVPKVPGRKVAVVTPSGTLGVRGTNFATEVDQEKTTRVTVFEGTVEVAAQGASVSVSADEGTLVKLGEAPADPVQILPPPALESPNDDDVIETEKIPVKFSAVEGAKRYLVEMAQNGKFVPVVAEVYTDTASADVALPKDYRLWIRVSAVKIKRVKRLSVYSNNTLYLCF